MKEVKLKVMKKIKCRQGFTLIEVLIAIAIIGILSSIATLKLTGITSETTKKADLAVVRTIASAVTLAMSETYDVSFIESKDIEKYLSNIKVEVGDKNIDGWSVFFKTYDIDENIEDDFIIYKDGIQVFPDF